MRYSVACLLLAFSSFCAFSQIKYEKGYFIDNGDKRVDCFILNDQPKNNPTVVKYKIGIEDDFLSASITEVKEFQVSNSRYIRATVQLDKSSQDIKNLSLIRTPDWVERQVFLKVIVDGKADLFYYGDEVLLLFFFRIDDSPIEQLVYKHYLTDQQKSIQPMTDRRKLTTTVGISMNTNFTYINQLNTQVSCENAHPATIKFTPYRAEELAKYFINYNKCIGSTFTSFEDSFSDKIHFSLRPGVDFSRAWIIDYAGDSKDFSLESSFRIGGEAEFILPFKNGKWGFILEPTYQSYHSKSSLEMKYRSIEIPLGFRHYFFLGETSRIFVNGSLVIDFPLQHSVTFKNGTSAQTTTLKVNLAVGLGYNYKRLSVEGRYYTLRSGVDETGLFTFDFKKSSIIIGYRVF